MNRTPRLFWVTACLALVFTLSSTRATQAGQWIVVTAPAFRKTVEPLCQQRKSQGLHVVVVQTTDVLSQDELRTGQASKLREHINKLCHQYKGTSYVLLVGALTADKSSEPQSKILPALTGTAGRMKGQPSDNGYGCLDDSRLPTVAVGRFPVRTEDEARGMVAKTLQYERTSPPGMWRRRLVILAGIPAYNPIADRLVESLALARLARLAPLWTGQAIYSNPQSRFTLPDDRLHARALQYVQRGEAFTLYLGHSNAQGLYGGRAPYLDRDDWADLRIQHGPGVFVTFGCNGCQLKGEDGQGYGLAAMRNAHGPAAVIGSHGICFAAMVQLAADGLFESTFTKDLPERLGDSWLAIKQGLAHGKIDALTYRLLDAVDGDAAIPQAVQRQEHLEMFLLLGDPALRLPKMPPLTLTLSPGRRGEGEGAGNSVTPGEQLIVNGKLPKHLAGARVQLSLERGVNSVPDDLEEVSRAAPQERDRVILCNHERANRFVLTSSEGTVKDEIFQAALDVPAKLPWPRVILRVYAANERAEAMAVRTLRRSAAKPSGGP